jgi:uncharacterized protein YaeQ
MTFISAFYNFTIELNHADRDLFTSFRVKVPRHELESIEHFFATIIAYCHCYSPELKINGTSPHAIPSMSSHDSIGELQTWIHVGVPDKRSLELSLKQNPHATHTVYFYEEEGISRFCHYLRGSTSNWIERIKFYQLAPNILTGLATIEETSPAWNISFIDDAIYLTADSIEMESQLVPIDMWVAFQESLRSSNEPSP